jgi:DNA-binding transcriptional regulator WhiA
MIGIQKDQRCAVCGVEFYKKNKPHQKFCSKRCSGLSRISLDNNIFSTINNQSAYILGLIWADGNIYKPPNSGHRILLDITLKDKELIEDIHKIMTPTKKLYKYKPFKGSVVYSIKTRDPRITSKLITLGLVPNKSHVLEWPKIALGKHEPSFIRGMFDGDGCVFVNRVSNYSYLHVSFTGCRNQFIDTLYKKLKPFNPKWYKDKRTNTWQIRIYSKTKVQSFAKMIYSGGDLCLNRKKEIFLNNGYLQEEKLKDGRKLRAGMRKKQNGCCST